MAIQTRSLSSLEHDWYATRSGLDNGATLEEHKAKYYSDKGFGSNASIFKPLGQMESDWLASVGSSTANTPFELWLNACQAQSVTPGVSVDDCKRNFFNTIASGTNP